MIKNKSKILAIIENANICEDIIKKNGSLMKWVNKVHKGNKKDLLYSLTQREKWLLSPEIPTVNFRCGRY